MIERLFTQCLVRPADVPPSREDMTIIGTFNPGVGCGGGLGDGDVMLLVRVCEAPLEQREGYAALPRYDEGGAVVIDWVANDEWNLADPRVAISRQTGLHRLRFVSYLLPVCLAGGREVTGFDGPRFEPQAVYESFGIEDPRITRIGDKFYITYVAVSRHGISTALASTTDFTNFERHGIIFHPENKDVLLYPEQIGGRYWALHRPNPDAHYSPPAMWIARSPDLLHWGGHRPFFRGGGGAWQCGRVGGGTPPIRTERGWLMLYHGNDKRPGQSGIGVYAAAAILTDLDDPTRIIAHSDGPVLVPEADFEKHGFVGHVVFPTGLVERGDELWVYGGAADECCSVVGFSRAALLENMQSC